MSKKTTINWFVLSFEKTTYLIKTEIKSTDILDQMPDLYSISNSEDTVFDVV